MKIRIFDKVLFRVPQFPVDASLEENWDELKKSISQSSKEFYEYIKDIEYSGYKELSEPIKTTVQKYYNRARFRATPYGTFAGFGLADIKSELGNIIIDREIVQHNLIDWQHIQEPEQSWINAPKEAIVLFTNSSYYVVGNQIRYLYQQDKKFDLSEIEADTLVLDILSYCKAPKPLSGLIKRLHVVHQLHEAESWEWIVELIKAKLLLTNYHPNIIGEDYFKRLNLVPVPLQKSYTITERTVVSGHLPTSNLQNLSDLVNLLHRMQPPSQSPVAFTEFIQRFSIQYDQREMPLLEALDPEIGIGYGEMVTSVGVSLAQELEELKTVKKEHTRHWLAQAIQEAIRLCKR